MPRYSCLVGGRKLISRFYCHMFVLVIVIVILIILQMIEEIFLQ